MSRSTCNSTHRDTADGDSAWLLICATDQGPSDPSLSLPSQGVLDPVVIAQKDGVYLIGAPLEAPAQLNRPSRKLLRDYQRVIQACFSSTTTVPIRFGAMVGGRERALEVAADAFERLGLGLDRVRGCVEMGVRTEAAPRAAPEVVRRPTTAGSGAEYLIARSEQLDQHRRDETQRPRIPALLSLEINATYAEANASRSDLPVGEFDGPSNCFNFLVYQDRLDAFRQGVERWRQPDTKTSVTGPWPPFSFAQPQV